MVLGYDQERRSRIPTHSSYPFSGWLGSSVRRTTRNRRRLFPGGSYERALLRARAAAAVFREPVAALGRGQVIDGGVDRAGGGRPGPFALDPLLDEPFGAAVPLARGVAVAQR